MGRATEATIGRAKSGFEKFERRERIPNPNDQDGDPVRVVELIEVRDGKRDVKELYMLADVLEGSD